jgi:hypothetical protein
MAKGKGRAKAPAAAPVKATKGGKSTAMKATKTAAKKAPAKVKKPTATKSTVGKKVAPPKAAKSVKTPNITASATAAATNDDDDIGELDVVLKTLVGGKTSVITDNDGTVYDVKLAKIDLKKNEDKYYIIQAVKDGKKHFCFTRWGRTG